MRALTWLVGVMVILLGVERGSSAPGAWTAVWIGAVVLWFFVGCVLGVLTLSKLVSGKMAAGLGGRALAGLPRRPAADKEKHDDA